MTAMRDLAGWVGLVRAKVEAMRAEILRLEKLAAAHRADCEREREQNKRLVEELLQITATAMQAKSENASLDGEIAALRSRNLWQRLVG